MVHEDPQAAVNGLLGQPGVKAEPLPDFPVLEPVRAPAHEVAAHQDVREHGHEDPDYRDAAFLQGFRIVEDTDRAEIVFDGLDEPVGNRYILVRGRDESPCPGCCLCHDCALRRGAFNLAASRRSDAL